jgi:hypothetical protein
MIDNNLTVSPFGPWGGGKDGKSGDFKTTTNELISARFKRLRGCRCCALLQAQAVPAPPILVLLLSHPGYSHASS